ncbi:reverse transcriptase [Cucumis melo var. makuwa]|uniref:Reverse transcriptase n=1 Tax=Cucumis melo var. makuwa TaxID=1194695 RepID=A0A5D3D113_CUCMM|nr:reverse transcriptase [Cucumis melo var. makuwa]
MSRRQPVSPDMVFHEYLDKFVMVYLDDIVIYSTTMEEHRDHLQKEEKIAAIRDWAVPKSVSELRSFPSWDLECQAAFDGLKQAMMEGPPLGIADVTKPFEVETDASDYALGGVLLHNGHSIAYESRKLNATKKRYTVSEKEMLAVVHCLRAWRQYLLAIYLLTHLRGSEIGGSVKDTLREFLQKDHATQNVMNLAKASKTRQFWIEEDLLVTKGNRHLRKKLLYECHDTLWAGHPGWQRTYALLKKGYFWQNMRDDVIQYTKTCLICQQDKVEKVKVVGLFDPLPVSKRPWETVSKDFITHLPKVGDFKAILVIIDRSSKEEPSQALNSTKEWKQTNDIARAYLEKASKRMKKWANKKRRPLEFRAGQTTTRANQVSRTQRPASHQEVRRTSRSAEKSREYFLQSSVTHMDENLPSNSCE